MKMVTNYNLTKRNEQGEELTVMVEVEDEIGGKFSQQEMKARIQAETKAIQEALQETLQKTLNVPDHQKPRLLPCALSKKETMLSSRAKNQDCQGECKATDRQINMINTIVPKMNKTVEEVCKENNVTSVQELTYAKVNKIKKEYDEFKETQGFEL